ncbi:hypothetical protein OG948_34500 (plasmid) [Embleya sp. NBC_00888]|nr:hypothetical protein OG948_34500 [Embleya sp. NBC_00888]
MDALFILKALALPGGDTLTNVRTNAADRHRGRHLTGSFTAAPLAIEIQRDGPALRCANRARGTSVRP